ncbi:hypothetical protein MIMGU_mgv1a001096mg [Erythranthe guttata]|uniref:J domain-containing protein n=1 Tax=Erythranthe guttata TaxID=4155 RepID=A0A022RD93_ERYGU|nr:hypothetical protein MIMGU_mgv1a001096mg [Erythranthe guttata]
MDDLDMLGRDIGLGTRGKSNPMRSGPAADRRSMDDPLFSDVFGGQTKYAPSSNSGSNVKHSPASDFYYDSIFKTSSTFETKSSSSGNNNSSPLPVYDKPLYDDEDIFGGLPGVKNKSPASTVRFDNDVFASISSPQIGRTKNRSSDVDDFLGNLRMNDKAGENSSNHSAKSSSSTKGFDDLLAGFGSVNSATSNRPIQESRWGSVPTAGSKQGLDDPFVVLNSNPRSSSRVSTDPLEKIDKISKPRTVRAEVSSGSGEAFDDLYPVNSVGNSSHSFSPGRDNRGKDGSPSRSAMPQSATTREPLGNTSLRYSESNTVKKVPADNFQERPLFDVPNVSTGHQKSFSQTTASPQYYDADMHVDMSQTSEGWVHQSDEVWLTVSEIPLFTQPSTAPPPSRPPPPVPRKASKSGIGSFSSNSRKKGDEFSSPTNYSQHHQSPKPSSPAAKGPPASQIDELEDFASGRSTNTFDESGNVHSGIDTNVFSAAAASAAAMKDAMDKAEAKFRHAKEVRERENAKGDRVKESERATREARERAAAEARDRAANEARLKAERAAVEKANTEARERAERAAVQRAQAEARERAAADAKERAEKAAAEARERTAAEAREKELREKAAVARAEAEARRRAERAAVERAAAEARERAAAEARERAANAKMNQQKNDNDLESFFNMGRESTVPRPRTSTTDPFSDQQFQNKGASEATKRPPTSSGASSNIKKASPTPNFVDDLSSIFGGAPSAVEFQEIEGETDERRRARLDRQQRTQERAAKALAEKNQRDLQAQRDQEERNRIGETLDFEIKRWAAGKEGNLRALLSTMQYVLWPECGWTPVSLTDLITGASVKKVYRKATLCIHPDKVQQKGATLQQKYIAEKVFDLLKEAWNKFNSEELF